MRLFHKFEPLADLPLRDRLLALADRTGFACNTILMMDGSKRSAHSNAFFMGFGKARRIVLFDTLVKQLTPSELEAVLAHEIGHFRCGHIPRRLVVSGFMTLLAFWLVDLLLHADWFKTAFGFEATAGLAPVMLIFALASGVVTFWSTPISSFFSRKQEFEADAFANQAMGGPNDLIQALRKLYQNNLGNLTPHPLYSAFYYSHPVLPEREGAMVKASG
jgi:STE24 endopeptidase